MNCLTVDHPVFISSKYYISVITILLKNSLLNEGPNLKGWEIRRFVLPEVTVCKYSKAIYLLDEQYSYKGAVHSTFELSQLLQRGSHLSSPSCPLVGTRAASAGSRRSQGERGQLTNPEKGWGNCRFAELLFYCFTELHLLMSEAQPSDRKLDPGHQPSPCGSGKLFIGLVSEHEIYHKEPSLEFCSKLLKTQNIYAL